MKYNMNRARVKASAFLALALFAAPFAARAAAPDPVREMETERQDLSEYREELERQLAALENDEEKKEVRLGLLEKQIETTEKEIDNAVRNIETLNGSIAALEKEIEESGAQIGETMDLFKKRIAVLYRAKGVSTLEILCNAESLYDFSMRVQLLNRITGRDRELIEKVTAHMEETAAKRDAVEKNKAALAEERKRLEADRSRLVEMREENQKLIEEIRAEKGEVDTELRRTAEEENILADRMRDLIAKMKEEEAQRAVPSPVPVTPSPAPAPSPEPQPTPSPEPEPAETPVPETPEEPAEPEDSDGPAFTASPEPSEGPEPSAEPGPEPEEGPLPEPEPTAAPAPEPVPETAASFAWPVPGSMSISDTFGNGHYGLDIPAPYGTPIVASRSGTVMVANADDDWGDSWGYYVSIYHDGTFSTLYAHMSSVAVTEGEWVEQGQIIGYVGSTGYSFGDHCHFEVYQNGTRVDPQMFL